MCLSVVIAASPSQADGGVVCDSDDPNAVGSAKQMMSRGQLSQLSQTRRLLACLLAIGDARQSKGKQG